MANDRRAGRLFGENAAKPLSLLPKHFGKVLLTGANVRRLSIERPRTAYLEPGFVAHILDIGNGVI
jgi:hypothetical protein